MRKKKRPPVDRATLQVRKQSYQQGVQARQQRRAFSEAPGPQGDPLRLHWERGWLVCQSGECQSNVLIHRMRQIGLITTKADLEPLERQQRIELLDWLDTAPGVSVADPLDSARCAFESRKPSFVTLLADNGLCRVRFSRSAEPSSQNTNSKRQRGSQQKRLEWKQTR